MDDSEDKPPSIDFNDLSTWPIFQKPPKPVLEPENKPRKTLPVPTPSGMKMVASNDVSTQVTTDQKKSKPESNLTLKRRETQSVQVSNEEILFEREQAEKRAKLKERIETKQADERSSLDKEKRSLNSNPVAQNTSTRMREIETREQALDSEKSEALEKLEEQQKHEREFFEETVAHYRERGELTIQKRDRIGVSRNDLGRDGKPRDDR